MNYTSYASFSPNLESSTELMGLSKNQGHQTLGTTGGIPGRKKHMCNGRKCMLMTLGKWLLQECFFWVNL